MTAPYSALGVNWARTWRRCHGNKSVIWHPCRDPESVRNPKVGPNVPKMAKTNKTGMLMGINWGMGNGEFRFAEFLQISCYDKNPVVVMKVHGKTCKITESE